MYRDLGVVPREGREDNFNRPGEDLSTYRVVYVGDLVLNKMKTWQGSLGISSHHGIVSPAYFVCRPIGAVDSRFVHHLLRSQPLIAEYGARSKGIRPAQWDLPWEAFREIRVSLPDLHVQREIADFLDAEAARIDALMEKKQRMIALLEERRTALTIAGAMNPAWPRVKLTLLARLGSGHTPSRSRPEWWEDPTIPWITTGDIAQMRGDRIEFIESTRFSISELGLANSAAELHPAETVVLSRTASVGFSAIMARPMATSQDFATWTCGPRLRPRFLLLCLRAMRSELLGRLAMGSTHKTIYMPDIESIRVPLPSLEEQDRAVSDVWARLRPIDRVVDAIDRQVTLLRELRQALITAAVTGQLDVAKAAA
ncbi:MAG TPA: restriction endonuclease subunit S [Gaiellaceae bacterium]|nr:restriction endonuclease subunit S [Gaiellaceae bacterium]